jgi:hypothetical protein
VDANTAGDRERVCCIVGFDFFIRVQAKHQQGLSGDMEYVHRLLEGNKCSISQVPQIARFSVEPLPYWSKKFSRRKLIVLQ